MCFEEELRSLKCNSIIHFKKGLDDSRKLDEAWRACWRFKHLSLKIGKWITSDEQDMEEAFDYLREVVIEIE